MKIIKPCLGRILTVASSGGNCLSSNTVTQLANAGIIAGTTFFSTLAGTAITDTTSGIKTLGAASIAAGLAFFTSMSVQRKVNQPSTSKAS